MYASFPIEFAEKWCMIQTLRAMHCGKRLPNPFVSLPGSSIHYFSLLIALLVNLEFRNFFIAPFLWKQNKKVENMADN